jgi:cytochrome P450
MEMDTVAPAPASNVDLFSDEVLRDPYPTFRRLRDLGPAVYLSEVQMWWMGRYDDVRSALSDWKTFSSAQGNTLNVRFNESAKEALPSLDPPNHTEMRKYFSDRLGPAQLKSIEDSIDSRADELTKGLFEKGHFDGVSDVACDLPVNVIMDLIGWPEHVRPQLLDMAAASFDVAGPDNLRTRDAGAKMQEMFIMIGQVYDEGSLTPGGFGSTVAEAAHRGEMSRETAIDMLAGYVIGAFDTTINAIASGLSLFARHPEQWDRLRADPDKVNAAVNEILRLESPAQHLSRVTTRDVEMGDGVVIPKGARVIMSYASANRDERCFADPDRFDINRKPVPNLAFGWGVHGCVGQGLARLEARAVFTSLAKRVSRLELVGEPVRALTNAGRGFASLPLRISAD